MSRHQAPLSVMRALKPGRCGCISPQIEHRLFSHISMNWRGRPLTSHEVIAQSIAATTTATGLTAHTELDTDTYPVGVKIPDTQMKALQDTGVLHRHDWHPEWNYTLNPPGNCVC